jgi:anti-sigma factor RsiW
VPRRWKRRRRKRASNKRPGLQRLCECVGSKQATTSESIDNSVTVKERGCKAQGVFKDVPTSASCGLHAVYSLVLQASSRTWLQALVITADVDVYVYVSCDQSCRLSQAGQHCAGPLEPPAIALCLSVFCTRAQPKCRTLCF